jgi:hypothetical protein
MRHGKWEVLIDPECARYKDLKWIMTLKQ